MKTKTQRPTGYANALLNCAANMVNRLQLDSGEEKDRKCATREREEVVKDRGDNWIRDCDRDFCSW